MKIKRFEIIDHGYEDSSYFQGCGTAFTDFDYVATGIGINAKEAYEDALDQIAMNGYDTSILPRRPAGIRKRDKVPAKFLTEESDVWWRVSIRVESEELPREKSTLANQRSPFWNVFLMRRG